jgi:nicotinate dehydrogenase subunit A
MPTSPLVIHVNGRTHPVAAAPETPLLYVLRNELELNSPQFGCGLEQCGACAVLLGARLVQSCRLPVAEAAGAAVTTLEGLAAEGELHPVQRAFLEEQAAQCGFCTSGLILATAALLAKHPRPSDAQAREALDGHLCRCGVYARVLRAVQRSAELLSAEWGGQP